MFCPPDRVIGSKSTKLVFRLGKHILDQLLEAPIKLLATATGLGENESTLLDEITNSAFALGGKLGALMAVEKNNRCLQHELHGGRAWVDNLPRQQAFPVTRHNTDQITDVVGTRDSSHCRDDIEVC